MHVKTKDNNGHTFTKLSDYLRANGALDKFIMNLNAKHHEYDKSNFRAAPIVSGFLWRTSPEGDKFWRKLSEFFPKSMENDLMWILDVTKEEALKDPRIAGKLVGMLDELYSQIPARIKL